MTLRALVVSGVLTAATVVSVMADEAKAPVQVSVQVVRSCRVTTDQSQVSVNCGTRPQPVQVSYADAPPVAGSQAAQTTVSPAFATSVTIHF